MLQKPPRRHPKTQHGPWDPSAPAGALTAPARARFIKKVNRALIISPFAAARTPFSDINRCRRLYSPPQRHGPPWQVPLDPAMQAPAAGCAGWSSLVVFVVRLASFSNVNRSREQIDRRKLPRPASTAAGAVPGFRCGHHTWPPAHARPRATAPQRPPHMAGAPRSTRPPAPRLSDINLPP